MLTRFLLWALLLFLVLRAIGRLIRGIGEGTRGTTARGGRGRAAPRGTALEQGAGAGNVALPAVIGQDAVMADAHQAGGQNVPTESADELDRREGE